MIEETICLQCGSIGYENAFVYCIRCLNFAVHRYCLDVIPETFDELVRWHCDYCKVTVQKQDPTPTLSQTLIHHEVSENTKVFSGNKKKNDDPMLLEASTASEKSESLESGELATQHISVELDVKNDENATGLPTDVIKISPQSSSLHQLEEEQVEGNLIGTEEKNKKFTGKKKRKRNVTVSTIEGVPDERLKADINECTRLASDLTSPSEVKENGSSEKKDEEKKIKNMKNRIRCRKKKRRVAESTAQKELHSHASANVEECVKVDITECTRSVIDSTLASKVKENGSEKKDEDKKINDMNPSTRKRKKKNKRNIVESNIEEEKHRLATASRSTPDSAIPPKVKENGCSKHRDVKNKNIIKESSSEKDQHGLATASYDERVKEDINKNTVSEVKEHENKDQMRISKPFDSIANLGTTGVPAGIPVNSSDEPSKVSKEKKTVTSSETISREQVLENCVAQPLHTDKRALSTEETDLVPSQSTENRGSEDKEEQASTSCQSTNSSKYYPNELGFSVAQPIAMPIWRGSLNVLGQKYEDIDELMAHISNKACYKVYEAASQFQPALHVEMLPKTDIWPNSFRKVEPNGDNIALYFFPSKISKQVFEQLVEEMIREELAFRAPVQKNAELLIFTSTELPLRYWRFHRKYYLWGVFRQKQANPLSFTAEVPSTRKIDDDRSPISPLYNSAKSVENNENLT